MRRLSAGGGSMRAPGDDGVQPGRLYFAVVAPHYAFMVADR
jgi:hypothetical protein